MTANPDLMWYDDGPNRTDLEKIERACDRFKQKFSRVPTVCFVHPSTSGLAYLQQVALEQLGVNVYPSHVYVPAPYHFRIGSNGNGRKARASV